MTKEEKELLLKDLCARLPYDIMCNHYDRTEIIANISDKGFYQPRSRDGWHSIEEIKPYLRPMSSMTKEEEEEQYEIITQSFSCSLENSESSTTMLHDWLLSKHFDVRGLINKNLALEAPEDMYNIK